MPIYNRERKREYDRLWVAKRRAAFFADKSCTFCKSTNSLEIHHIDPSTKIANSIWSWSQERRDIELTKCIILCYTCHKEETRKQKTINHIHGTLRRYNKGCRCEECYEALRNYWSNRRVMLKQEFGPKFRKLNITEARKNLNAPLAQVAEQ